MIILRSSDASCGDLFLTQSDKKYGIGSLAVQILFPVVYRQRHVPEHQSELGMHEKKPCIHTFSSSFTASIC